MRTVCQDDRGGGRWVAYLQLGERCNARWDVGAVQARQLERRERR
jgi:hypothetical protein